MRPVQNGDDEENLKRFSFARQVKSITFLKSRKKNNNILGAHTGRIENLCHHRYLIYTILSV